MDTGAKEFECLVDKVLNRCPAVLVAGRENLNDRDRSAEMVLDDDAIGPAGIDLARGTLRNFAPLFLAQGMHVKVSLEPTYLSGWEACPEALREAVVTGILPNPDAEA